MGIDLNINNDLVQNTIIESLTGGSNIYQEYASEIVSLLYTYKNVNSSIDADTIIRSNYNTYENICIRVCNGISNNSDFQDFCKCLYDTAVNKELYKGINNTSIWGVLN